MVSIHVVVAPSSRVGEVAHGLGAVLVVGASGAIGTAVARRLGADGTPLGLHYCRNAQAVEALKSELAVKGSECAIFQASLDTEESCNQLVDSFSAGYSSLSGIAICSGEVGWREWRDVNADDWNEMFFQHCLAPFFMVRRLLPSLEKQGNGKIVYLSSISPKYGGSSKTLHYASAKAALETAMLGLTNTAARHGITINGVRAGFVDTPQQHRGRLATELATRVSMIPLGRPGTPDDIAGAFAYLMSDAAAYVTGQLLTVGGGD